MQARVHAASTPSLRKVSDRVRGPSPREWRSGHRWYPGIARPPLRDLIDRYIELPPSSVFVRGFRSLRTRRKTTRQSILTRR